MEEESEGAGNSHQKRKLSEVMRENPWILSSAVLGIIVLVFIVGSFSGGGISKGAVGNVILDFANAQTGGGVTLSSVEDMGDLYEVVVNYEGNEIPLYLTKDGKNLVQGVTPLTTNAVSEEPTATEIPKSDKPVVELFVWAYCPYGVQAQGPMAEVANLLSGSADFEAVLYYGGHGEFEVQQNKIQECIQKLDKAKYWNYAAGFVETIYSKCGATADIDCDKSEAIKLMNSLGIDSSAVMACVASDGEDLIAAASQKAQENDVSGSPTIIINGVKANVARDAESIKTAVCSAYNNAPADCDEVLDSTSAATSGNC